MRGIALLAAFVVLWQAVIVLTGVPPFILPAPARVLAALWSHRAMLAENAAVTGMEVGLGMVIGSALGIAAAVAMALSPWLCRALRPALVASQAVPVFALAPVLTLWLGFGTLPKIVMTVLIVFFPLASVFLDGLMAVPEGMLDLGRLARAPGWRVLVFLRLPMALPSLGAGLTVAAVYAPIGAVIGEWVGAAQGLGYVMTMANARSQTDVMFAALVVLVAMTLALHWAAGRLGAMLRG